MFNVCQVQTFIEDVALTEITPSHYVFCVCILKIYIYLLLVCGYNVSLICTSILLSSLIET